MRNCLVRCLEASMCSISVVIIVQSLSRIWLLETPWTAACQASMSFTISWSLLKLTSIESRCHPIISSSVALFSCLQPFPVSGSFPMGWLFASGNQSIGASASASVLPMNWFDLLAAQGILKGLLQHHNWKASVLWHSLPYGSALISIHDFWKNRNFDYTDLCWQSDVSVFLIRYLS